MTAYVDNELDDADIIAFEEELEANPKLLDAVEAERAVQISLRELPRLRAPRNFTLDPARYGRPQLTWAQRYYPQVRTATAVAGVLLVALLSVNLLTTGPLGDSSAPMAAEVAMEPVMEEEAESIPAAAQETSPAAAAPAEAPARAIEEEQMFEAAEAEMETAADEEALTADEMDIAAEGEPMGGAADDRDTSTDPPAAAAAGTMITEEIAPRPTSPPPTEIAVAPAETTAEQDTNVQPETQPSPPWRPLLLWGQVVLAILTLSLLVWSIFLKQRT